MILAAANEAALTISPISWVWFVGAVLVFLALDLGVFHRKAHAVGFREALIWTAIWFSMAMAFALWLAPMMVGNQWGADHTKLFITGYVVELSLSMDNVFVIALIFSYFRVPLEYQHRVLFWGILGALVMRGAMIFGGAGLIHQFDWILYVFGAFLLFSGIKMLFVGDEEVEPEKNIVIRLARRIYPCDNTIRGTAVFHPTGGLPSAHAARPLPHYGRDHRLDFCGGLHPGHLRHHHRAVHCFYVECVCNFGPTVALFSSSRSVATFLLPEIRPGTRAGVHRIQDVDRPLGRPARMA